MRRIIAIIVLVAAPTAAAINLPVRHVSTESIASPVPDQAVDLRAVRTASRSLVRTAPPKVIKKAPPKIVIKKKVVPRPPVATVTIPATGVRALGQRMAAAVGWTGANWQCLNALWTRESNWRVTASNPSGAYGIPQALPGSRMGPGWRTDPVVQISWGIRYVASRYGNPCGALAHSNSVGWY